MNKAVEQITVLKCTCQRCEHKWTSRGEDEPVACPGCKSRQWREVRKVKVEGK